MADHTTRVAKIEEMLHQIRVTATAALDLPPDPQPTMPPWAPKDDDLSPRRTCSYTHDAKVGICTKCGWIATAKAQEPAPVDRGELRHRIRAELERVMVDADLRGRETTFNEFADRLLALLPAQGIVLPASEGEFVRMLPTSHMLDIRMRYDGRDYTIDGAFLKQWGPKAQGDEKLRRLLEFVDGLMPTREELTDDEVGAETALGCVEAEIGRLLAEDTACPQDEDRGKVALSVLTAAAAVVDECAQDMMPPRLWPLIESLKKAMEAM